MIKTLNTLDKGGSVVDLTGASADYPLAVGETAVITYTAATSVSLRVATVEGLYEVDVTGPYSTGSNPNYGYLKPNNTDTATNAVVEHRLIDAAISNTTSTNFRPFGGYVMQANLVCATNTTNKTVMSESYVVDTGNIGSYRIHSRWTDTTTAWTSLGTITFPFAQSGKIVIRRII